MYINTCIISFIATNETKSKHINNRNENENGCLKMKCITSDLKIKNLNIRAL